MLSKGTKLKERFSIIQPLGKGGFGQVYQALDEDLKRIVAIKERRADRDSEELRRAFRREAQLLANLGHPVLPKVHDHFFVGQEQYIVMEFIEGDDLAKLLKDKDHPFAVEEVLLWADEVLKALEYLHNVPIIHCDIKPDNIKLTSGGKIFLLDFGLAQGAYGQMSTPIDGQPNPSVPACTPEYAPLEQLKRESTHPQSDIYSVGATLYHLLTGQLPYSPLLRYEDIQHGHGDPLLHAHEINPAIPTPISEIISQALAVYWRDRIKSASEMRTMLQQARQKIAHAPPASERQPVSQELSPSERSTLPLPQHPIITPTLTARRWWLALGLAALLIASIALLVGYNFFGGATSVGGNFSNNQITGTPTPSSTISPVKNIKATPSTLKLKQELKGHTAIIWAVAFSLDGSLLASASADGAIILWNTETWEHKEPLRGHKGDVYSLSFSPDGQTLASAGKDKTIKLWNTRTGQLAPVQLPDEHKDEVWRVAFSPDGKLLASADKDKTFRLWDVSNGWMSRPLLEHTDVVLALAFAPDGSTLASTGFDGRLLLWDVHGGAKPEELKKYAREMYSVAYSPDGKYLVCAGEDGSIKRWRRQSQSEKWEEVGPLERHTNWVLSLAVSPDSKLLVSIGKDDKILLWDLQSGASKPLNERVTGTRAIAFSPDGQTLVSGGEDTIVRVWQ